MSLRSTAIFLCIFFINNNQAYDLEHLQTLVPAARASFDSLKWFLWCSPSGAVPSILKSAVSSSGREKAELDAIPRFKKIKQATADDFNNWIKKQTEDTIHALLVSVDEHKTMKSLVEWQNETYPEELTIEDGFKRLFQSAHFKSKKA